MQFAHTFSQYVRVNIVRQIAIKAYIQYLPTVQSIIPPNPIINSDFDHLVNHYTVKLNQDMDPVHKYRVSFHSLPGAYF